MAADLKKRLGAESTLIPSSGGVFDVTVDGKLVWSKKSMGRFPETFEILKALDKK